MIEQDKHIKELYDLNHRKDELLNTGFDYQNKLFERILSNVMFGNSILSEFLKLLQKNAVYMIESNLIIRNFWNYTVSKFYDKHNN